MLYRDSYKVNISDTPPEADDVLRALLGMTVDELAEAIARDPERYADLYGEESA